MKRMLLCFCLALGVSGLWGQVTQTRYTANMFIAGHKALFVHPFTIEDPHRTDCLALLVDVDSNTASLQEYSKADIDEIGAYFFNFEGWIGVQGVSMTVFKTVDSPNLVSSAIVGFRGPILPVVKVTWNGQTPQIEAHLTKSELWDLMLESIAREANGLEN